MAAKVARLAAAASSLPFVCAVYAEEKESKSQLVKPKQLPIYCSPPLKSKYIEEQPGRLQKQFSSIRLTTGRYIGWCKDAFFFAKNGIVDSIQFGKDAYVYLKNPPPDFLPRVGIITISGLAGVVLARKAGLLVSKGELQSGSAILMFEEGGPSFHALGCSTFSTQSLREHVCSI